MFNRLGLLLFILILSDCLLGQSTGKDVLGNRSTRSVPFVQENGFILVDLVFNHKLPMRFIFDTGAQNTILFDKIYADFTSVQYDDKIRLLGSDLSGPILASIGRNVNIKLANFPSVIRDIIVLEEDYINLEEIIGVKVQGILGTDYFKNLIIEIDYIRSKITFHDPLDFNYKLLQKYQRIPARVYKNKAYIETAIQYDHSDPIIAKLLIDTGASVSLLLHLAHNSAIVLPENTISGTLGKGLGGDLLGYIGLIKKFELSEFQFNDLITNFQSIDTTLLDMDDVFRDGILGNTMLSRFNVFIDFRNEYLYLKPNKTFDDEFDINKSGLSLIATGKYLNEYLVTDVLQGSSGDLAGVLKGDLITAVGPWYNRRKNLSSVLDYFSSKDGKQIQIKVKRQNYKEILKFKFKLRNPLIIKTQKNTRQN